VNCAETRKDARDVAVEHGMFFSPKAMLRIAALCSFRCRAMRGASSIRVGNCPPCFATIRCAAFCRLRARRSNRAPTHKPQHFFWRRSGERMNIPESAARIARNTGSRRRHGFVQHDFRKPDAIRVTRLPPRQVALELAEPAEQLFAKCGERMAVQHSAGTFLAQPHYLLCGSEA